MARQVKNKWENAMARAPWTVEELGERLTPRYESDERRFCGALQVGGSLACRVYDTLGLDRSLLKVFLRRLQADRRYRAVLCGVVCASRFKFFEASRLLPGDLIQCSAVGNAARRC